jgi:hypothetical protein
MFIPLEDFEDFARIEDAAQQAAAEQIQPWQRELKPGDFFYRNHPCGVTIFGEVLPVDADEADEQMPDYRFVRAYSQVLPEGEMGEIHISTVAGVLTAEDFAAAKARGWKLA